MSDIIRFDFIKKYDDFVTHSEEDTLRHCESNLRSEFTNTFIQYDKYIAIFQASGAASGAFVIGIDSLQPYASSFHMNNIINIINGLFFQKSKTNLRTSCLNDDLNSFVRIIFDLERIK